LISNRPRRNPTGEDDIYPKKTIAAYAAVEKIQFDGSLFQGSAPSGNRPLKKQRFITTLGT
jgi:hypothetical protein